jgi:hypothetical protein
VLLDQSGQGSQRTRAFTTSGDWEVADTFDCSDVGNQDSFQFHVQDKDGTPSSDVGANDRALSGGANYDYRDAGQHYLEINSACRWHITVTE